ncbi:MAG: energy transducer TonB, partial [Bacteroidales bacterium]|nr:energy transducer TonB [Bacteroidales bacterium]
NTTRKPSTNQTAPNPTQTDAEERDETPVVNPNALFRRNATAGGGGSGTGEGSGSGSGSGTGSGSNFGSGSGNEGGDFFLNGRPVINKAFPKAKNNLEGVVRVEFRADKEGNVVYAKAGGRGTNIHDPQILEECKQAAMRSKFKAKSDAQAEEIGIITYRFIIQ